MSNRNCLGAVLLGAIILLSPAARAECVAGSVTLKAPLYTVTVDASGLLTYQQLVGNVTKKASLRTDCVGFTTYTVSGTRNLPYANGTRLLISGKTDFNAPAPTPLYLTVSNGSIDGTVTASGAQTGINSDPLPIYFSSLRVMQVKQPWK